MVPIKFQIIYISLVMDEFEVLQKRARFGQKALLIAVAVLLGVLLVMGISLVLAWIRLELTKPAKNITTAKNANALACRRKKWPVDLPQVAIIKIV